MAIIISILSGIDEIELEVRHVACPSCSQASHASLRAASVGQDEIEMGNANQTDWKNSGVLHMA